jgi:WD40 repeat protein
VDIKNKYTDKDLLSSSKNLNNLFLERNFTMLSNIFSKIIVLFFVFAAGFGIVIFETTISAAEPIVLKTPKEDLSVISVCFSPDGKKVITGNAGNTVRIWDAETGKELLKLKKRHNRKLVDKSRELNPICVFSVCFSPDGKKILTGSNDMTARTWDAETGEELLIFAGHASCVSSVCFSPDGKKILTGGLDETARIWDAETAIELLRLTRGEYIFHSGVSSVCFSPDGKKVITGLSHNNTIPIRDAETGKELLELKEHTNPMSSVCFSPDGKKVMTGCGETVRIWDAETGELLKRIKPNGSYDVISVCFSPDGKKVMMGHSQKTAIIHDLETGKELLELVGSVGCFSPDSKKIVTTCHDDTAQIWDVESLYQDISNKKEFRIKMENGSPEEQFELGNRFYTGNGVSKDVEEALIWWKKAGLRGHKEAVNAIQKHIRATLNE